jgi:hypothetical protein
LGGRMRGACHCMSSAAPNAGRQNIRSAKSKAGMGRDKQG